MRLDDDDIQNSEDYTEALANLSDEKLFVEWQRAKKKLQARNRMNLNLCFKCGKEEGETDFQTCPTCNRSAHWDCLGYKSYEDSYDFTQCKTCEENPRARTSSGSTMFATQFSSKQEKEEYLPSKALTDDEIDDELEEIDDELTSDEDVWTPEAGKDKRKKKKPIVAQEFSRGAKSPMSVDSEDESLDNEAQSDSENFEAMKELLGQIKEYEAVLRQLQRTRFEKALQHEKTTKKLLLENQRNQFANYAEKMVDRQKQMLSERDRKMHQRYKEHFEKEVARFKKAYTALRAKNQELKNKLSNVDSSTALSSTSESEPFGFTMPPTPSASKISSVSSPLTDSTETFTADSMQDFESGSFVSAVNSPEYLALKAQAKKLETPVGKKKKEKKKRKKQSSAKVRLAKCTVCRKKDATVLTCSGFLCKMKTHLKCVNEQEYRTFPETEDWYCTKCRLQQQYADFLASEDSLST